MKKILAMILAAILVLSAAAMAEEINVTSREDGSGTRGAFIELFGIEQKDADGNKVDYTTAVSYTHLRGGRAGVRRFGGGGARPGRGGGARRAGRDRRIQ